MRVSSSVMAINPYFSESGALASSLPAFESRPQQVEMARIVEAAQQAGERVLIEAGTGIGKSFAYLLPAIDRAITHHQRVVVSTHTIALQEQLIEKDIPALRAVFGDRFSAVLVKGRSNYLGLRRLARASERQAEYFPSGAEREHLHRIEDWAYETDDGTLSDLSPQPPGTVWDRVRSDGDDCWGRKCPQFSACFFQNARAAAAKAQVLVVNHALLFADVALRRRGGSILPDFDHLIIDEAHTIENVAADHLGIGVTTGQVHALLHGLYNERTGRGTLAAVDAPAGVECVRTLRASLDAYVESLLSELDRGGAGSTRLRKPLPFSQRVSEGLVELRDDLRAAREGASDEGDKTELAGLMERCRALAESIRDWHAQEREGWVYWMERSSSQGDRLRLSARPIDVGDVLREELYDRAASVILTSATLTTSGSAPFAYVQNRLGLSDANSHALGSPFDYARNLEVYVEGDMPEPNDFARFVEACAERVIHYVQRTEGRAFVLFTSYEMLRRCAALIDGVLRAEGYELLVQGAGLPRSVMLQRFRERKRCVLLGTDSFWAGVDVPGRALENVIITRLPFASPGNPVVDARIDAIRERGGNPFFDYQIPEAILRLRQGVGRVLRTATDRGIVVLLDPRIVRKPYGKRFLQALPECPIFVSEQGRTRRMDGPKRAKGIDLSKTDTRGSDSPDG